MLYHGLFYHGLLYHGLFCHHGLLWGHAVPHVCLLVPNRLLLYLASCTDVYARYAECLWCDAALRVFWIASRVHMGGGVGFVSHALCYAFVTIVPGVVAVRPTIFGGLVAPDVVREVCCCIMGCFIMGCCIMGCCVIMSC